MDELNPSPADVSPFRPRIVFDPDPYEPPWRFDDEPTATIRSGWIIQIGATDDIAKAKELLSRAKDRSRAVARAHAFTEKVQKGKDTLYRARFAGLQEASAESACRELKRSGFACFTMKN